MFVIWHDFLTPHLNTHNRWRSRAGERAKEGRTNAGRRNCRDGCSLSDEPDTDAGKRADSEKQKNRYLSGMP